MRTELKRQTCAIKNLGEGRGTAVFATLNVIDKDGDVTLPGAFGKQSVVIVPAHNWGSVPLGKGTIREVGEEAHVDFEFNLDSPTAREWFSALKFDVEKGDRPLQEWSYGFTVNDAEFGEHDGQRVRFLKTMEVHEVSPVLVGAGENTRTLVMKSAGAQGRGLDDHIKSVLEDAGDLASRVTEIREMRARKGKDISDERLAEVDKVVAALDEVAKASRDLKVAVVRDSGDAVKEAMRFEAHRSRRTLTLR
jgi:hypothetical protein